MVFENESKLRSIAGLRERYSKYIFVLLQKGLVTYFRITDDLIFMFEIKILI